MSSPKPLGELSLYAAGLGVMIYSPRSVESLAEGEDYMPMGEESLAKPLAQWVSKDQTVVLLGTGSPQLDYRFRIFAGAPSKADLPAQKDSSVRFGLKVQGDSLAIRDGYDPMKWSAKLPAKQRPVKVPSGYYAVTAVRRSCADAMEIDLFLAPTEKPLRGDGWPILEFEPQ